MAQFCTFVPALGENRPTHLYLSH